MERSRNTMPVIQHSKGAFSVALVVSLCCAFFGVGGAVAGDGKYARHVRHVRLEARLAGAALAHRTPEQLVLAITPKKHHAPVRAARTPAPAAASTPAPAASTPAPAAPAAGTTLTDTSAQPAATTPAPTSTTLTDTSTPAAAGATTGVTSNLGAGTTGAANTDTATGATPTDTTPTDTTTTAATPTDTTTTASPNDTTTAATPNDTTTAATPNDITPSATPNDTTVSPDGTGPGASDFGDHGHRWWNGTAPGDGRGAPAAAGFPGSNVNVCHGRCDSSSQGGVVVPASSPSPSPATSGSFTLGVTPAATTAPATTAIPVITTPVAAVSGTAPLVAPTIPATTTSSNSTASVNPFTALKNFPTFRSTTALRHLSHGSTPRSSSRTAPVGTAGSSAATAAALSTPRTAAPAGRTLVAAAPAAGTTAAKTAPTAPHTTVKHDSSGSSVVPAPITRAVHEIVKFIPIKVIPTAIWIGLGAAFGLALAFGAIALRAGRRAHRREREFKAISAAAATDALTGILNRRGFMDAAERELARASRYDRPFVLAYVDVRGLKAVNDTEGHLVGDELIQAVAGLMKESARADDVVGRIGGDEFALLLDEQTAEGAQPVLRRIGLRVEERRAAMEIGVPWELTIGIAAFPEDGTTVEELLGTADRRLYEQRGIALR
jgi:diguanylate cyclase (GGDEF)-like protein